ncbi:MAG TPA: hypothetical protein PLZ55_06245 [bacterium]|nr:hypothetical protein [bacterium]HPO08251.1 hypothetical protein [bacterium]HQO35428.1 hypothetical protein [bacterium]HQP98013.1 hypothetical protein [bacterium]
MLLILSLILLLSPLQLEISPLGWQTDRSEPLERELFSQGIPILRTIDVKNSEIAPLPEIRKYIRLPLPEDARVFLVDGSSPAFNEQFAVRLQPDGNTQSIDGFTQGRLIAIRVPGSLEKRFNDVLRHELVHAYLNVVAPNRNLPPWLEEGLACYFSGSPNHLNHETYRLYERDMRYLFKHYPDRVPYFLSDALSSMDANEALFLHIRIPDSVRLHIMRLSWENALWISILLVPVLALIFGRFLSELLYPWYVGVRRRYLGHRYMKILGELERRVRSEIPLVSVEFAAAAQKAATQAGLARRLAQRLEDRLCEISRRFLDCADSLIVHLAPYFPGFGVHVHTLGEALHTIHTLPLMRSEEMEEVLAGMDRAISAIGEVALARPSFPPDRCVRKWIGTQEDWKREREQLRALWAETAKEFDRLHGMSSEVARFSADGERQNHPLVAYGISVQDALDRWRAGEILLPEMLEIVRDAEQRRFQDFRTWIEDRLTRALFRGEQRMAEWVEALAERDLGTPARRWGHQDFVPRIRREGYLRWLYPPDALETASFALFFCIFAGSWGYLRRFCAFFLQGVDRLLGG